MRFVVVPPREGVVWVRRSFQIFFRQPLGFASLFAACALIFFLLLRLPVVGEPILLVVTPAGSLLFMIAARLGAAGQRPVPGAFLELLAAGRPRIVRMLKLGLAYLVAALIVIALVAAIEGESLAAFWESAGSGQATPETTAAQLADPRLQGDFVLRLALVALLSIPFWHAPGLVFWGAQSWAKALFFSTLAIWRNKGAFAVYGLVWVVLAAVMMLVLGVVVGVGGQLSATYIATPLILFFTTVLYVSLWFTFAGCFADDELAPPPAGA